MNYRSQVIRFRAVLLLLGLLVLVAAPVRAQLAQNNSRLARPTSRLHRSYEAPVFITGHIGVGGSFQYDHGEPDYGGSFIFRPGSAVNFLEFLANLNSAMVLRLDHQQLGPGSRNLAADLLLRRYFADRGTADTEVLPFVGLGLGASDVVLAAEAGRESSRYWSYVAEAGQEWFFKPNLVVVARIQYRLFSYDSVFVSTWSVSCAVGIPVPW